MLRDKGMRQDFPGILGEKAEQLELDRRQLYLLSVQGRASCSIIDFQDSIRIYGTVRAASGVHDGKTPDRNAQTGKQLVYGERFYQIIICARVQRRYFILILTPGADHNDRHVRPAPDLPDHLHAIHVRQTEVQKNDVRIV